MTRLPGQRIVSVSVLLVALAGAACSLGHKEPRAPQRGQAAHVTRPAPIEQLRLASIVEQSSPAAIPHELLKTPGVPPDLVVPYIEMHADQNAHVELHDIIERLRAEESPLPAPAPAPSRQAGAERIQALRYYSEARLKLLDGRLSESLRDLEQALRLDPNHPDLLSALGDAQHRLGRRTAAAQTMRRAIRAGANDPRLLWIAARETARSGDLREAARLLSRAWSDTLDQRDPALALLIGTDLGEHLCQLGFHRAGASLLAKSLALNPDSLAGSRSSSDVPEQLRRRGELWMIAGDSRLRLREFDQACAAYQQARSASSLDPASALTRLVHAHLLKGQPASAALLLLDDIRARGGVTEDAHVQLARHLSHPGLSGSLMGEAVNELGGMLAPDAPNSTRRSLASLAAACASVAPGGATLARSILLSAAESWGPDEAILAQLLDSCDTPELLAESLRSVVEHSAWAADQCVDSLASHGRNITQTVALLEKDGRDASRLLYASWLHRTGRDEDALRAIEARAQRLEHDHPSIPIASRRASLLAALGRLEDARAQSPTLTPDAQPADRVCVAKALHDAGEHKRALEALDPLLNEKNSASAPIRIEALLLGASIAARAGESDRAESMLQGAIAHDPRDPRPLEALLALHQPDGPAPDATKLTGAMRLLRQNAPGSPLIRQLVAHDLVQKSLDKQAEPQLMAILDDRGQPPSTLALLIRIWEQAATSDRARAEQAEAWLKERLASRAQSTTLALALSRVLVANGKAHEADSLLSGMPQELQTPELLRQREWVLRVGLGLTKQADEMALARLDRSPRSLDTLLELVPLQIRAARTTDASLTLEQAVKLLDARSSSEHRRALTALLLTIDARSLTEADKETINRFLAAYDHAITLTPDAREPLTLSLVRLLCAANDEDADALSSRVRALHAADRALGVRAELEARQTLLHADAPPSRGVRFLARLALDQSPPEPARGLEWMIITAARAQPAELAWLLDRITTHEQAEAFISIARERGLAIEEQFNSLDEHKAEVAHVAASLATLNHRDAFAFAAHRLALRHNPEHPWVANDHGYSMLERGGDINEAARLIELAYSKLPDETSIIDSLGWLRYKQGRLEDDPARADEIGAGRGALTLLELAASTFEGRANFEVLDHFADALWRHNKNDESRERARQLWRTSTMILRTRIQELRDAKNPRRESLAELQDALARINAKIEASLNGAGQPRIAEIGIPPVFTPRPEPTFNQSDKQQQLELDDTFP